MLLWHVKSSGPFSPVPEPEAAGRSPYIGHILVNMHILKDYQLGRINVWKNPIMYSRSGGYQVLQGLYAIGSGGYSAKGQGESLQKLGFVPEAQNDMIFSIICEELGLFGAIS